MGLNLIIKWIRGPAGFAYLSGYPEIHESIFSEAPVMQALKCMPEIEVSRAEVLVDLGSGVVQDYRILDVPIPDNVAWSDSLIYRNLS